MARSPEQIRSTMLSRLSGQEEGLVGLWNFEAGSFRNQSQAGQDGRPCAVARVVPAPYPRPEDLLLPLVVYGQVVDDAGHACRGAVIEVRQQDRPLSAGITDDEGRFALAAYPAAGICDLSVVVGDLGAQALGVRLHPGDRRRWDALVQRQGEILGVARLRDDSPGAHLLVEAVRVPEPGAATSSLGVGAGEQVAGVAVTDGTGAFHLKHLPPGRYRVRCQTQGGCVWHPEPVACEPGRPASGISFMVTTPCRGTWRHLAHLQGLVHDQVLDLCIDGRWGTLGRHSRWRLTLQWQRVLQPDARRWSDR